MARGKSCKAVWSIRYRFDIEGGEKLREFYAVPCKTKRSPHPTYDSDRVEDKRMIRQMAMWDPKVPGDEEHANKQYTEHNRRVAEELRELGLYAECDINTYLRTHGR